MNILIHEGVGHDENPPGRGSGRYGWGTGENPGQHQYDFLSTVKSMKKKGFTETEIAKMLLGDDAKSTQLRAEISIRTEQKRKGNIERAVKLYEKYGNKSEVARIMGVNESNIRNWLDPAIQERKDRYQETAEFLKKRIADTDIGIIDIGAGTEIYTNCPAYTKDVAVEILKKEGYVFTWVSYDQPSGKNKTTTKVLAAPGTEKRFIQEHKGEIQPIQDFTPDEGKTWWTPEFPESLSSDRVKIRYAEEGGKEKDGVIELRRGVEDLSLGASQYAQVRIAVDGKYYMKGMAIYGDDIPKGYDVVYNTNKSNSVSKLDVLKEMKVNEATGEIDEGNPFGALIKSPKDRNGVISSGGQSHYIGKDGKDHLSPINKLRDEGDWKEWSRQIASQMLSKQPLKLIRQQLNISIADKKVELEKINALTNPIVKQRLLVDFAESCDANAVDLSAKGFKNQAFQVILPIPSMKENEIYAPNYNDGDRVALIRYPHGGIFEIPILKVNNRRNPEAKRIMKNAKDAVGINHKVAEQLSGADFDGDTVTVIPLDSNNINVSAIPYLEDLKTFDPKIYKLPDSAPKIKGKTKQTQMGIVTNLITDMTVGGAKMSEICRAVKHSMVVIDSEKHHLDYKKSAIDNNISELKKTYQGVTERGNLKGASTILSKASSTVRVDKRKEITNTKIMTPAELKRWNEGKKVWRSKEEKMLDRITDPSIMTPEELKLYNAGKKVYRKGDRNRQEELPRMALVDDARDLVRNPNNPKEMAYANYANELKSLANQARKEARSIKTMPVNTSAAKVYEKEVEDLNAKLRVAKSNQPKERRATAIANAMLAEIVRDNPSMDYEHKQRERTRCQEKARAMVGARKEKVVVTEKEWEAIQANAISSSKLREIISNADSDAIKKLATPKGSSRGLTTGQMQLIRSMSASGMYTQKEIADKLGVSVDTVNNAINK